MPPASIPKFATTTESSEAAETFPPARIASVETLLVNVRLLVTVKSPPVSSRRVEAVMAPSSVALNARVPLPPVPAVIARELV